MKLKLLKEELRGKSVKRSLDFNLQTMGLANRQRSRALTETQFRMKESNEAIRRQAKSDQNKLFSKVAIQPTPDLAPPAPVMQDSNFALLTGLIEQESLALALTHNLKLIIHLVPVEILVKKGGDSGGGKTNKYLSYATPVDYTSGSINYYGF